VPDGNPTDPPPGGTPQTQPPVAEQQVTDIAVFSLAGEGADIEHVYMILEKAGTAVIITFYDTDTNTFYTATDSADTVFAVPTTPQLDSLLAQTAAPGNLSRLIFSDADGTARAPQQVLAGMPPSRQQVPGGTPTTPPAATIGPIPGAVTPGGQTPVTGPVVGGQMVPVYGAPVVTGPVIFAPPVYVAAPTTPPIITYQQVYTGPVYVNPVWIQSGPVPGQSPVQTWLLYRGITTTGGGTGIGGGIIFRR
jgi:hypothetical protein